MEQIQAAATEFLTATGWAAAADDPELITQAAAEIAANCTEIANDYLVGDLLHAEFDVYTGEWIEEIVGNINDPEPAEIGAD